MNPKVLSMFHNAKIFLSTEELKELALCIDKEFGKTKVKKEKEPMPLENWTQESVTEYLLATHFKKKSKA
jgi:3'-phosphoadenosine 5'-phosphosulfate sulfotransferase (PAPS reductase)/FAD synthetase